MSATAWKLGREQKGNLVYNTRLCNQVCYFSSMIKPRSKTNSDPDKLLKKHRELVHTDNLKVLSHVQREAEDWILNTLMIEGYDVPFRFKRRAAYRKLKGTRVNLTYYPESDTVAGIAVEVMNVVRIRKS